MPYAAEPSAFLLFSAHAMNHHPDLTLPPELFAPRRRELLAWGWHGRPGLCGPYFLPAMDKTAYKTQLTYPVANTAKDGGRCCQPFGRSTIVWGAGKEYPVRGEDFAFMLQKVPGCYFFVGNGGPGTPGACNVHNPGYDFNDDIIGPGATFWCGLVQAFLDHQAA